MFVDLAQLFYNRMVVTVAVYSLVLV